MVPAVGRTISALDDSPGSAAVAVISHSLWVRHLARRPDVVGQTLGIDGQPTAIVGVLPVSAHEAMYAVGVVEVLAGLLVAVHPRLGAAVVALWLGGIIINLLLVPGFYDVALRDFGLLLAAVALQRLATRFDPRPVLWPFVKA